MQVYGHFFKKLGIGSRMGQEWFKYQNVMHIIGFWVLIIFHECVHRWGKYSPPSLMKSTNV